MQAVHYLKRNADLHVAFYSADQVKWVPSNPQVLLDYGAALKFLWDTEQKSGASAPGWRPLADQHRLDHNGADLLHLAAKSGMLDLCKCLVRATVMHKPSMR